jgi:hypothetical protein
MELLVACLIFWNKDDLVKYSDGLLAIEADQFLNQSLCMVDT